jgi:hypothetical protein
MIELTGIAYVRSGAADLAGPLDFATRIVGPELVDGDEPGVAHLRAQQPGPRSPSCCRSPRDVHDRGSTRPVAPRSRTRGSRTGTRRPGRAAAHRRRVQAGTRFSQATAGWKGRRPRRDA